MTTKQQHTACALPLQVQTGTYKPGWFTVRDANGEPIGVGPFDNRATAALFAAAPELLAAHMDDDLAKEIASLLIGDTLVAFLEWRDTQCAAIAKALGE